MLSLSVPTLPINAILDKLIADNPNKVAAVLDKPTLNGWFVAQVMKETGGQADPNDVMDFVHEKFGLGPVPRWPSTINVVSPNGDRYFARPLNIDGSEWKLISPNGLETFNGSGEEARNRIQEIIDSRI